MNDVVRQAGKVGCKLRCELEICFVNTNSRSESNFAQFTKYKFAYQSPPWIACELYNFTIKENGNRHHEFSMLWLYLCSTWSLARGSELKTLREKLKNEALYRTK